MQKQCGIYLITCRPQYGLPLYYVGQSQDVPRRLLQHRASLKSGKHHNRKLLHHWRKYGADSFTFELIELCELDALDECEMWWLNVMVGHRRVFNIGTDPVAPMRGIRFSDEHRQKIAQSISGEKHYRFGRPHSPENRAKISAGGRGLKRSQKTREAIGAANRGEKNSMFGKSGALNPKSRPVTSVCMTTGVISHYESACAAESHGYRQECISRCCNGLSKYHKGAWWFFT